MRGYITFLAILLVTLVGFNSKAEVNSKNQMKSKLVQSLQAKEELRTSKYSKAFLVMELARATKTRFHALEALKKSMSPFTRKSFKDQAKFNGVDLRKPLDIKVFENLDFSIASEKYRFKWDVEAKAYFYKGKKISYDHTQSVSKNFESLKSTVLTENQSSSWLRLFFPVAYAQDIGQVIFDLNYLLYIRSRDEATLTNELGTDYIASATEKMNRLVQTNQFLRMECSAGSHAAEAIIVLGDGSPGNEVRIIAQDTGSGTITSYIERDGRREEITDRDASEKAQALLNRQVFQEVCENMTGPEVDSYSSDLYYYGTEAGGLDQ